MGRRVQRPGLQRVAVWLVWHPAPARVKVSGQSPHARRRQVRVPTSSADGTHTRTHARMRCPRAHLNLECGTARHVHIITSKHTITYTNDSWHRNRVADRPHAPNPHTDMAVVSRRSDGRRRAGDAYRQQPHRRWSTASIEWGNGAVFEPKRSPIVWTGWCGRLRSRVQNWPALGLWLASSSHCYCLCLRSAEWSPDALANIYIYIEMYQI